MAIWGCTFGDGNMRMYLWWWQYEGIPLVMAIWGYAFGDGNMRLYLWWWQYEDGNMRMYLWWWEYEDVPLVMAIWGRTCGEGNIRIYLWWCWCYWHARWEFPWAIWVFRSLLLCSCHVFRMLNNSLYCRSCTTDELWTQYGRSWNVRKKSKSRRCGKLN